MIVEYGSHRHDDASVELRSITQTGVRSNFGEVYAYDKAWEYSIWLRAPTGADAIITLKDEVERVYAVQNQRVTLYTNSGKVAFRLDPSQTLSGTKVTAIAYPELSGAAMVSLLRVDIRIEARVEVVGAYQYLQFEESVEVYGGGPKRVFLPSAIGDPEEQTTRRKTPYFAVQSGIAVGRRGRPGIPPFLFSASLLMSNPRIGKISPSRLAQGVFAEYGIQWSMLYGSKTPLSAEPHNPP